MSRRKLVLWCVACVWVVAAVLGTVAVWKWHQEREPTDADVKDVLVAYAKNPANGDQKYKGKRLRLYIPAVKISRAWEKGRVKESDETVASYLPEPGVSEPYRHICFHFVGEDEIAHVKPGTSYIITGECDGLERDTVIFLYCTAKPAVK